MLRDDSARAFRFWAAVTAVLLTAWAVWFVGADVPLYVGSESARMEAVDIQWVEAPVAGQIRAVRASLGDRVRPGDVIVELDTSAERLRETEQSLERNSATTRVRLLRSQLEAAKLAQKTAEDVGAASIAEAHARAAEASEHARQAANESQRTLALFRQGLVSESQRDALLADSARAAAAATVQQAVLRRMEGEHRVNLAARQGEVDRLLAELSTADNAIGSSTVASRMLEHETELRLIRARIAGRIGSDLSKRAGAFIDEGERLTSIIPSGRVIIVGYFAPETSAGRVRAGQTARFRLDAFPVGEHGWVEGRVLRTAAEPMNGQVRVEVGATRRGATIPIEHGLTGSLEIETESVSPLVLVLRAAGKRS